jgi:pantothenate kinase
VRRTKLVVQPPSAEEAAVSASLYMNPATTKIASNLVVTWEPAVAELLDRMSRVSNPTRPFLVGIIGIPGSGKSTSSEIIKAFLDVNEERSIVMPMDGFHLPLQKLAEHPNAADMIYRRGAPDTFDPAGLATALRKIAHGQEDSVCIPGFDHAKGDPVQDQHKFERERHKIVICEGIYLLHDSDGWENIKSFFDWTIYIDANVDACIERLKQRNKCIPVSTFST